MVLCLGKMIDKWMEMYLDMTMSMTHMLLYRYQSHQLYHIDHLFVRLLPNRNFSMPMIVPNKP